MNQVAQYLLVIALTGATTYFISNRRSDINSLEMEVTHWRAQSVAFENELALLRQKYDQLETASHILDNNREQLEPNKKANAVNHKIAATAEPPTAQHNKIQNPKRMLDNKLLDSLLQNGELEQALYDIRNDLKPEQRNRLMSALAKLQESSVLENSKQYEASDPEHLRARIDRSIRILEVNRVFEHELGIGVSQFLNSLDSSAVQDLSNK